MRPLPRTTETERWYRVRGKKRRPRVIRDNPPGTPATPSGGKDREAIRGSSSEGDVPTQTRHRRPGGSREGNVSRETMESHAYPLDV